VRKAAGSKFTQRLYLDWESEYLRVENEIDWHTTACLCKILFPMTTASEQAVYDLGCGVATRGVNTRRQFEVPAQTWADLSGTETSQCGKKRVGVSILSDSRAGWDHPNSHTLRLTAVFTPYSGAIGAAHTLDFGITRFAFGVFPHAGTWRQDTLKAAENFTHPVLAVSLPAGGGTCAGPRRFAVHKGHFSIRALKAAEETPCAYVVRVQENLGMPEPDAALVLGDAVTSVRELWGDETVRTPGNYLHLSDGVAHFALEPFELRTFLLTCEAAQPPLCPKEDIITPDFVSNIEFDKERFPLAKLLDYADMPRPHHERMPLTRVIERLRFAGAWLRTTLGTRP
jgi:alpha-mannosidase